MARVMILKAEHGKLDPRHDVREEHDIGVAQFGKTFPQRKYTSYNSFNGQFRAPFVRVQNIDKKHEVVNHILTAPQLNYVYMYPGWGAIHKLVDADGNVMHPMASQCHSPLPPQSPEFKTILHEMWVNYGESITLQCEISGQPSPTVTWFKNKVRLHESDTCFMTYSYNVAQLKIYGVSDADAGLYACHAENPHGVKVWRNAKIQNRQVSEAPIHIGDTYGLKWQGQSDASNGKDSHKRWYELNEPYRHRPWQKRRSRLAFE